MKLAGTDATHRPWPGRTCLRWEQCLAIAIAFMVVLALPNGARAIPGYEVHPGGVDLILPVEKRAGYVVSVSANQRQRVQFAVNRHSSATEYSTVGRVSSHSIEAAFGTLGRINVTLHLRRFPPDPPHEGRCMGRAPVYKEGTYRGVIAISRQGDVPKILSKRGRVYFERRFRQVCKRRRPPPKLGSTKRAKRKVEVGFLTVDGKGEGRTVILHALSFASRRRPTRSWGRLSAAVYERREGVRITKRNSVAIYHNSFTISDSGAIPETVQVNLPEPFAGHALYSRSPGSSPSWTGNLSLSQPGTNRIPLAGSNFSAVFCRGFSIARVNRCILGSRAPRSSWRRIR